MQRKSSRPPYHEKLTLKEFTCFHNQTFEFVDDINVFVGENGTGKTHAMKALYAFQKRQASRKRVDIQEELYLLFQIDDLNELVSKRAEDGAIASVAGTYGGHPWEYSIQRGQLAGSAVDTGIMELRPEQPIFIPAIDMIGHSKGFLETSNYAELDFDSTCTDILSYLGSKRRASLRDGKELEAKLREVVVGEIEQDPVTKRFTLVNERGRFPMPMVAEGIRKIATLRKLVENNWISSGATLFWDEPEVNLNPKIMDEVVQAILMIGRRGVQVFLATHSYLILKELEVNRKQGDSLKFFSFECSEPGTEVHPSDTYLGMHPNLIEGQYASLYDRQIQKEIDAIENGVAK